MNTNAINKPRWLLLGLLCLIGGLTIVAQDLVERTVCVFDLAPLGNTEQLYSSLCSDTIAIELERLGYTVIANEQVRGNYSGSLQDEPAMLAAAKALGADVAVSGFYVIDGAGIHIGVKAIDIITGLPAVAATESGSAGFEVFDTIDVVSASVAARIREALQPLPASEVVVEREEIRIETTFVEEIVGLGIAMELRLESPDDGAAVLAGDTELGVIADGFLVIKTTEGNRLELVIRRDGYFDRALTISASPRRPTVAAAALVYRSSQQLVATLCMQTPFSLAARYEYFFLNGIVSAGGGLGLAYIPLSYPWSEDSYPQVGFFLNLPVQVRGHFYPLALFAPASGLQPYLALQILGDPYMIFGDIGFSRLAFIANGRVGLGLNLVFGRILVNAEFMVSSPAILALGTTDSANSMLTLSAGAGYRW
ncbi:MAG TPA: hypothetical protein DD477_01885 [Spirochaetaceae bacterium]|nr:hypothetical protein [Spirochaetaceae bacterium]